MITRWLRRSLRRVGFDLPFTGVVCPEHVKSICVEPGAGAMVTVRRTLVFLETPEPGDLMDTIPESGLDPRNALYESPDALEIARISRGGSMFVAWRPRQAVTPYALYEHEYSWRPTGSYAQPAQYTEVGCDMRTGALVLEMITPAALEAAVVFKRPRWRRLTSERSVVQHALRLLDSNEGERPVIGDRGRRLEWRLTGPNAGDRYVCVAFHEHGVAQWQDRLKAMSLAGRLRQIIKPLIPVRP
jgi:hypothetical protein